MAIWKNEERAHLIQSPAPDLVVDTCRYLLQPRGSKQTQEQGETSKEETRVRLSSLQQVQVMMAVQAAWSVNQQRA